MEIVKTVNNQTIINKALFDYINRIWVAYDTVIPNDKNLYFMKNTTVPRLVTDYCGKNISRVIKKEKAEYCVIKKFNLENFPIFYDRSINAITSDDTKEVFYNTCGLHPSDLDCIEQIMDFYGMAIDVIYVNQDVLNESLNSGFILDKDNYTTISELVNSGNLDNQAIAANMIINSDLDKNKEWLMYIYHGNGLALSTNDKNLIVRNFFRNKGLEFYFLLETSKFDTMFKTLKDKDVIDKFVQLKKYEFNKNIEKFLQTQLNTNIFALQDFQLNLKADGEVNKV